MDKVSEKYPPLLADKIWLLRLYESINKMPRPLEICEIKTDFLSSYLIAPFRPLYLPGNLSFSFVVV